LIDKERARKLVLSRFGLLAISIDGARKKTYERIRGGASFDRLILNIKRLNFFKRGY
jgi:MoaA/NifB/PqqE/SkfB family radical SAM enzyme